MTFAQLRAAVAAVAFPKGEAESLQDVHTAFIQEALLELQRYVTCYRDKHVDKIAPAATWFYCGMSVADAVDGVVRRVYTLDETAPCSKVFYTYTSLEDLEKRAIEGNCVCFTPPYGAYLVDGAYVDYPDLGLGFYYPESTSDSSMGRSSKGWYALENDYLYVFPAIQSTEKIVVEWAGIKKTWSDSDDVFESGADVQRAVRQFVLREVAREIQCDNDRLVKFTNEFSSTLADLVYQCRQRTHRHDKPPSTTISVTSDGGCTSCG